MVKNKAPIHVGMSNRRLIYNYIYKNPKISQHEIIAALGLSRPTVATYLSDLESEGMIHKIGLLQSDQRGRKAFSYSIIANYRVAIGVEIMRYKMKIIGCDLYGRKIDRQVLELKYVNDETYYKNACDAILAFIDGLEIPADRVLGIGITMQGVASSDGRNIVYGAILGCTGLSVDVFERWLNYPCSFIHDPDSAALSELWVSPSLSNAVYLSLSRHLGGSIISEKRIVLGKHGHCATFEHIQAQPNGEKCYCGQIGCYDTLCSMKALLGEDDPDLFFDAVRSGDGEKVLRWQKYLLHLSHLIEALHLIHDVDFILGGHLAPYFIDADIQFMYDEIHKICPFNDSDDYILISKMPSHNITIGASLPYIQAFLDGIE